MNADIGRDSINIEEENSKARDDVWISVSIPIYNADKYLDQCIESIITQKYNKYELILVDDGSTDNSLAICEKWRNQYPNIIRILEKDNTGSLLTRKRCIKESKYEYLYILDADDYLISANAFNIIADAIKRTDTDLLIFDSETDNNKITSLPIESGEVIEGKGLSMIYDELLASTKLYPLWNKVFKKSLVDYEHDYDDYDSIIYGTDFYQTIPLICRAHRIVYIKECLYHYRFQGNNESIVHKFKPQSYLTAKKNQIRLEKFAHKYFDNVENLDKKLTVVRMRKISTAIYKVRLMERDLFEEKVKYLRDIGEDDYFVEGFSIFGVDIKRATILMFMRLKMYKLLALLLK